MKIALICPSNLLYMPYVGNYEKILKENHVDYDIINWDRFNIEDGNNSLKYRDLKTGHQRNLIDYYKFNKFIKKRLDLVQYKKIIVFGIQLAFFLKDILNKRFKSNYVVDIRDYNKIISWFRVAKVIDNSSFAVLSSPGFKKWLPSSNKYIINHNTQINSLNDLNEISDNTINREKINISYIGSIRDYKINIDLIESLKSSNRIKLFYHGQGIINKNINEYIDLNNIKNVRLTGRYKKEDEEDLYKTTDLVNVLIPKESINSKTLLPNRLYNAVIYGKPMLAFYGTYLAEQIENNKLGIVISSFERVEEQIIDYLNNFDSNIFDIHRKIFFETVIKENDKFKMQLEDFIK